MGFGLLRLWVRFWILVVGFEFRSSEFVAWVMGLVVRGLGLRVWVLCLGFWFEGLGSRFQGADNEPCLEVGSILPTLVQCQETTQRAAKG